MMYLISALIILLAYFWGSASTARIVAKSFRSLNIYKVGTGLADSENIYRNVSKVLGLLVGTVDILKSYGFLLGVRIFLFYMDKWTFTSYEPIYRDTMIMIYGMFMLIGHCMPVTHGFRGGRGIFTYMGFIAFFSFYPMLFTAVLAWFIVAIYKQIRFAQYLVVLLPVLLSQILYSYIPYFKRELSPHFLTMMFASIVLMIILNLIVSKRLGEI